MLIKQAKSKLIIRRSDRSKARRAAWAVMARNGDRVTIVAGRSREGDGAAVAKGSVMNSSDAASSPLPRQLWAVKISWRGRSSEIVYEV